MVRVVMPGIVTVVRALTGMLTAMVTMVVVVTVVVVTSCHAWHL